MISIIDQLTLKQKNNNQNCNIICQCKWKSGKETANCDHRSLQTIPTGLSSTIQVIDLNGNMLNKLPAMIFVKRGLLNLQRIYMANCHLVEISAESFIKLSNLIELDLSNNSLTTIPSRSLAECHGLRRLSLSGNRISNVKSRSFLPLTNLNWLDLSNNVIYHLDMDAFIGLRSLQVLKLQSNHLQTIPSSQSFVQFLSIRISLDLYDNQWRCDCHLKPFRDWIITNQIPMTIKPVCYMPTRLQGQTWDTISTDDFSCPPTINTVNTHYYKHIGNNVTIPCSVSGFPLPQIYWLFESTGMGQTTIESIKDSDIDEDDDDDNDDDGNNNGNKSTLINNDNEYDDVDRLQYNQQHDHNHNHHRQLLPSSRYSIVQEREQMGIVISKLTVHSLQPIDTQRITCYARNVGGSIMKNFTLIVSTQEPFSSSRSMDLLVSEFMLIVVAICILLMLLMLFLFVVIFRRKSNSSAIINNNNNNNHSGGPTNHVTDSSQAPEPNRLQLNDDDYRMIKPSMINGNGNGDVLSNNILMNGSIIGDEKSIFLDHNNHHHHQPTFLQPYHHHHHPHNDNETTTPANILMVNTIDMLAAAAALSNGNTILSADPSISTDLSSQSTTATSMNGNVVNIHPHHQQQNSTDSSVNSQQQSYFPFDTTITSSSSPQPSTIQQLPPSFSSHQPDILVSSNAYYLAPSRSLSSSTAMMTTTSTTTTTTATATQFPLLNSGPLFHMANSNDNNNHIIYGTTQLFSFIYIAIQSIILQNITSPQYENNEF
ncbi:Leucine rich repeat C-terminal domain [Dermatophagoides pteronyssinus]|uniref:Leucine rich repeat C-terminal domain n=1 Tax=Dermatophagoides pteronyssinus TaxID=6956 RepID=A0ABQ8J7W8_DERPT|nr:Leucine rich repeat C-terminal domain [Dermatophagoides pteronyssinus]